MDVNSAYVLLNYCCVIVMFACCISLFRQTASHMLKLALLLCVSVTICCIGFLIKSQATDVAAYLAGQTVAYAVVPHGLFFAILFVLSYCRLSLPAFAKALLCVLNFVVTFSVLTMNYHPYFYESCWAVSVDGFVTFEKVDGPLHTFTIALFMAYLIAIVVITVIFSIKNSRRKNYAWRLVFAITIPFAAYVVPKLLGVKVDLLALSCAAFSVLILYLIYQNKLYDINNIMSKYSIGSMEEAYIVFDGNFRIKGYNAVAEQLFPVLTSIDLDSDIREFETPLHEFLEGTLSEYQNGEKFYRVDVRSIGDRNTPHGKVIRLEDVTIQHSYTELLQENIDRINRDLALAKNVQESALPHVNLVSSAVDQIDVAAFMKTAKEVGGDFYDCYKLDENHVVFAIADVSDKGIPAALFMMRSKSTMKSLVEEGLPVNEVFNRTNVQLAERNDGEMFLTAWLGILDVRTGQVSFANAGHEKPLILRANGQVERLECRANFVLAAFDQITYTPQELVLNPGDSIFLYTDGVTDAADQSARRFGEEQLGDSLRSCVGLSSEETLCSVEGDIERFIGDADQFDDITMLMIKFLCVTGDGSR